MTLPVANIGADAVILAKYMALKQPDDMVLATYVWIDGKQGLRSKTRTLRFVPTSAEELPTLSIDGRLSDLSEDAVNSVVYLKPVRIYKDPFHRGKNRLVLCETVCEDGSPHASNTRRQCKLTMERAAQHEPWFGVEQEYFLMNGNWPLGWPTGGFPARPQPFYCGVGPNLVYGRDVMRAHYRACLYAGICIFGTNLEAMPGQLEFQIGPCEGVTCADDLSIARYLLHRIAEDFHVGVTYEPKPIDGWNANGAHTNFSTKATREPNGLDAIKAAILKLEKNHAKHIAVYDPSGGVENAKRLTGAGVTASIDAFSWGIGDRATSVRIPQSVANKALGYVEDRRPSGNMNPYLVTEILVRTVCLDE